MLLLSILSFFVTYLHICQHAIVYVQCQYIDVQTELGRVRGNRFRTQLNNPAIAFLGIPYALPPVGARRFKKPIAFPKWSPKTLIATNYKSCCPQLDMNGVPHGAEDCLHLNVFVPLHNIDQNQFSIGGKRFSVMIYIQGESFENGDAALYGAEKLLDWDVVLVTFNYRLGVLGFLSTGDEHASGNWGLYDQMTVLRWVHDHIESFSGNPNSVTIFGQGAGAASAFLHLISPLSNGLFHRVIAQSGSPLCAWSIENEPENAAHEVATRAGCDTSLGNAELVRCLRRAPIGRLLAAQQQGKLFGEYPHRMVPVIELEGPPLNERLVPAHPKQLIARGNYRRVPLLMGYNRDETAFLYPLILSKKFIGDSSSLRTYLEERLLPRFIRANILDHSSFVGTINGQTNGKLKSNRADLERDIASNILFQYFNFMNGKNYSDMAYRFVNMSTDALYGSCIDETLRLYSAATSSAATESKSSLLLLPFTNVTYKYLFEYRGRNSMLRLMLSGNYRDGRNSYTQHQAPSPPFSPSTDIALSHASSSAICHGDELFHLFALKFVSRKPEDNRDLRIQRLLLSLWTDFAKHGFAPLSADAEIPHWPAYTGSRPATYVIDDRITVLERYRDSATHFWTRYLSSIGGNLASAPIVLQRGRPPHSAQHYDHRWSHSSNKNYPNNHRNSNNNNYPYYYHDHDDRTSFSRWRTFAWSMLALCVVLLILVVALLALLFYQRRRQTFSAESRQRARQTSARTLARALAASAARQSTSTSAGPTATSAGLY